MEPTSRDVARQFFDNRIFNDASCFKMRHFVRPANSKLFSLNNLAPGTKVPRFRVRPNGHTSPSCLLVLL